MTTVADPPAEPIRTPFAGTRLARESLPDRLFRWTLAGFGTTILLIALGLAWELYKHSHLAWEQFGLGFFTSSVWDPVEENFGALPLIFGTLYSSALALLISVPVGVGCAIFLSELAPRRISTACTFCIELLAAVPSVVLGLMGIFLLVPVVRAMQPWLIENLGFLPLFRGAPYGVGMLAAAIILSIMILPFITSISRDVLMAAPRPLKEGVLALGATHWEMVRIVILPHARSGIIGAAFLALGRALGETMAVTMVIGNTFGLSWSLLDPGYTMAAIIANEFAEATSDLYVHALIAVALALFIITVVINGLARLMLYRATGSKA